jgi:hypothetical protein
MEDARITGVSLAGYTCTAEGFYPCAPDAPSDPDVSFTDNSITLTFYTLRGGQTYTFDIATKRVRPE